jgi:hypothetical protein
MSTGEILSLTHGFFGILLIVGTPWAMAELLALNDEAGLKRLKFVTLGVTISSFLSCVILAAPTYLIYYPAARAEIVAGPTPWAHGIFMEIKEHIGLIEPMLSFAISGIVWQVSDKLFEDKAAKKLIFVLLIISFALSFSVMSMGAYITKTGPIR